VGEEGKIGWVDGWGEGKQGEYLTVFQLYSVMKPPLSSRLLHEDLPPHRISKCWESFVSKNRLHFFSLFSLLLSVQES